MKILVYQVRIGLGNIHSGRMNRNTTDFHRFEQIKCLPSVAAWADRHGYDYKLITKPTLQDNNFFSCDVDRYSAEKMMHLNNDDYDYLVYVDSDVLASDTAGPFPIKDGFSIAREKFGDHMFFRIFPNEIENTYCNAGVFGVDTKTGKKLYKYFLDTVTSGNNGWIEQAEQDIINSWIQKNDYNILDQSWNHMLFRYDVFSNMNIGQNNFFHFIAEAKEQYKRLYRHILKYGRRTNV